MLAPWSWQTRAWSIRDQMSQKSCSSSCPQNLVLDCYNQLSKATPPLDSSKAPTFATLRQRYSPFFKSPIKCPRRSEVPDPLSAFYSLRLFVHLIRSDQRRSPMPCVGYVSQGKYLIQWALNQISQNGYIH